ncbi:MAG: PIG-L deacetylase family protein [Acidimicrobiales bacterium]
MAPTPVPSTGDASGAHDPEAVTGSAGGGPEGRRALAIGAHPDDIEFGAAGTIARWVDEGWDVRYVIVTSGQKGVQDAASDPEAFGRVREAESVAAARAVGVTDVTFLRYMDSEVATADWLGLRRDLSRQFRRHRPHRLLAANPEILPTDRFVNHPDHRAVATAALDITMTGGTTAAIFPELETEEGLPPWRDLEETWLSGGAGGSEVVDVTATFARKVAALRAHVSQVGDWDVEGFVGARLAERGRAHGYDYAESFRVISYRR